MGMPTVEKPCLVFDLKTGTTIIGVVSLVGKIFCSRGAPGLTL